MGPKDGQHRGVSTVEARQTLVMVAKRCVRSAKIEDAHRAAPLRIMARRELRRNLVSISAVLLLLLGYSLNSDKRVTTLALALLALCSLLAGVLIKVVCQRCETFELQDRVSEACEALTHGSPGEERVTDAPLRQPWGASAGLQQGSALASVVSVYRNDLWQRVPKLLLVEGDIVALMGGDRAPCTAEALGFELGNDVPGTSTDTSPTSRGVNRQNLPLTFYETGIKVVGGQHIDLRPSASEHFNRKTMVSATSPTLLLLCGDMRCYRLLETPLDAHLKRSLSPPGESRRTSLIRARVGAAGKRCYSAVLIAALLAAIIGGIRLVLGDGSRQEWALYLLVIPGQVAVCLLPMSLPIYLAAGEAVATARLLAFLELMLRRKRESKAAGSSSPDAPELDEFDQMDAEEREEASSGTSHTVSWKEARAYLFAVLVARWRCGTRSRVCQRPVPATPASAAAKQIAFQDSNRGPSDLEDGVGWKLPSPAVSHSVKEDGCTSGPEARDGCSDRQTVGRVDPLAAQEPLVNGRASKPTSPPWWHTLAPWGDWGKRWRTGAGAGRESSADVVVDHEANEVQEGQHAPKQTLRQRKIVLPVPMLECGLVERLGAVTTLCMLDEDTVCQPTSAIKEVFLVDSKDDAGGGSGSVLDMHTQQGKKGVRFEDPHWWAHLPALKPIGLTCLLGEVKQSERQQAKAKSASGLLPRDGAPSSGQKVRNQRGPARTLLDHVRDNQPMEHLTDLWKAIGFCAADRAMFRERRRIHVINPILAAERATEDTHAQGQDESRRRGTIQPHLTSVMAQDRRSGALQLLSQGNPSIVLGMCRDYWDGSAMSNLPANLRKRILGMHQQWSLEDLDVVAFAYTPVPYTVNPFLSSFSKHPDYLIHLSQSSGKGRSRGPALGPLPKNSPGSRQGPTNLAGGERIAALGASKRLQGSNRESADDRTIGEALSTAESVSESPRLSSGEVTRGAERLSVSSETSGASKVGGLQPEIRPPQAVGAPGVSSTGRGLTRGASESCLDSAQVRSGGMATNSVIPLAAVPPVAWLGQDERGDPEVPLGAVLETADASQSPHKKIVQFGPGGSHDSTTKEGNTRGALLQPFTVEEIEAAKLTLGLVKDDKKGGRRYSMDDYGVNIAHRAELQTSKGTMAPATGESKMAEVLWNLMHEQVFLGMAASFVPPKRDIVALIEDVEAAGVRFVYFSPRNMRRSKALAESMGIETDWNCAISLRPLEDSTQPDPHRMTSSYADWDVKARLPHGIAAIRDHIERVDNVPLLVSLFTDATPASTKDMLGIYQENDESVLAVGMSHRAVNADLFRAADLSFSVESLPLNQPLSSLPVASASRLSAIDTAFNSSIVGLHTALPLGDVVRRGGAIVSLDDVGSIIIDLIREGRRLLTNSYQALSFLLLASFGVSMLVLVAAAIPISNPMILGGDHLIWILWLVAPLLATSFLASPADGSLMKRTPEKNDPKVVPIAARLVVHLLLRTIPTALICVGLYVVLLGEFLVIDDAELALSCGGENTEARADWMDVVWCLARDHANDDKTRGASGQAVDLVLVELVLCLIFQSASFMYRTVSIRKEHPWKNWVWCYAIVLILSLQVLHLWASAAARETLHLLTACPWEPLVVGALCPFLILGIAELLKKNDARVYNRYITLLRLEFETRLGMHSPR